MHGYPLKFLSILLRFPPSQVIPFGVGEGNESATLRRRGQQEMAFQDLFDFPCLVEARGGEEQAIFEEKNPGRLGILFYEFCYRPFVIHIGDFDGAGTAVDSHVRRKRFEEKQPTVVRTEHRQDPVLRQ